MPGDHLSGATAQAVTAHDWAVRAFNLAHGYSISLFEEACLAPATSRWHILVFALANDICLMIEAKVLVETAGSSPVNEREQAYGPALTHFVEGARTAAVAVLDRHLMRSRLTLWCIGVPR